MQSTDGNYYAWDPMHIHDNFVTDVGGDGIVRQYASGSRVEHNTVEDVANTKDGQSMNGANAAVWPWNADDVSFRYNHVFGTVRGPDNNDGQAFDADFGVTGNLYEHNLSHDNEGGSMLFCGCWGLTRDTVVRYNVSLNDGRPVPLADGSTGIARTFFMAGQADGQVYNNSFLLRSVPVDIAHPDNYLADSAVFANNVFLAQEETEVQETATAVEGATIVWRNNVFGGREEGWPEVNAEQDNIVLPELTLADGVGLERLRLTAAQEVGAPIAPEGVLDFVGNPVRSVTSPDAEAFQLTPVEPQVTVADGGFELDPT